MVDVNMNFPAHAPHMSRDTSGSTVHMLCMWTPTGQEECSMEVGDPLESRTPPQLPLDKAATEERLKKAKALALRNSALNCWNLESYQ
jgi:hypothetical protein